MANNPFKTVYNTHFCGEQLTSRFDTSFKNSDDVFSSENNIDEVEIIIYDGGGVSGYDETN